MTQRPLPGMPDEPDEQSSLIDRLIADPSDPRTERHQFENGYTEYVAQEDEMTSSINRVVQACLSGTCDPQGNAHKVGCSTKVGRFRDAS